MVDDTVVVAIKAYVSIEHKQHNNSTASMNSVFISSSSVGCLFTGSDGIFFLTSFFLTKEATQLWWLVLLCLKKGEIIQALQCMLFIVDHKNLLDILIKFHN